MKKASIKSIIFRGKKIKYINYITPIFSVESYMEQESSIIDKYLKLNHGDIFIDIGSCVGSWSLPALSLGANVIGIDPVHIYAEIILENVYLNGWENQFGYIMRALWYTDDEYIGLPYGSERSRRGTLLEPLAVKTIRLDSLNLPKIDLIKIDVEGLELAVLKGAKSTIERLHPQIILEHHHNISGPIENVMEFLPGYSGSEKEDGHWILSS